MSALYEAFMDLSRAFDERNVELRESGPAYFDATSGNYGAEEREYDASMEQHRAAFDVCDLGDVACDASLLSAVIAGDVNLAGRMIVALVNERIQERVRYALNLTPAQVAGADSTLGALS